MVDSARGAELLTKLATAEEALRERRAELEPAATAALEKRRAAIQHATSSGFSRGQLARLTGLARGTIQQIAPVAGEKDATPAIDTATRDRIEQAVLEAQRAFQQATTLYLAQLEPALQARNKLAIEAASHCTRREIAEVTGLSVKRVQEIVRGEPYGTGRRKRRREHSR